MKKINKNITAFICLLLLSVSCDRDLTAVEEVLDEKTSGAILRTSSSSGSFDMFRTENTFAVALEEQDEDNGELIDRVDITIQFIDENKDGDNVDDTVSGIAFGTISAEDFSIGERGLPVADFTYTMEEALEAMDIPLERVLPGDNIRIDLELLFTDGRSFNASDAATTVTGGSFFSSPFQYTLVVDDGIEFDYSVETSDEIDLSDGAIIEDYEVEISIDDESEGTLLETLNIYKTFRDLTIGEDGTDLSEEEALFETFAIADLTLTDGAKTLGLSYTLAELLPMGVTLDSLAIGDDIQLRYEIITADGRIVTTSENDTEYFYSIITSECIQLNADAPYAGDYTIEMTDSYGDGWNGGFLTITLDGVEVEGSPFSVETGEEATGSFTIPEGATSLELVYTTGAWDDENSFFILDPNGKKSSVEGPYPNTNGEGPFEYVVELKVCE